MTLTKISGSICKKVSASAGRNMIPGGLTLFMDSGRTAMLLLRKLLGINTQHIRVLQDNHTSQEFDVGRV